MATTSLAPTAEQILMQMGSRPRQYQLVESVPPG